MWSGSYSEVVKDIDVASIWAVVSDVDSWAAWDDVEFATLHGAFATGSHFTFKPKGAPKALTIELIDVVLMQRFTDLTRFPMARMTGKHEYFQRGNDVEIRVTMSIEGPMSWVWRKIVAENIVKDLPKQTAQLIKRCQTLAAK